MPESVLYNNEAFRKNLLLAISKNTFDFIAVAREDNLNIVYINEIGIKLFEYENTPTIIEDFSKALQTSILAGIEFKEIKEQIILNGYFSAEISFKTKNKKHFWGRLQLNHFEANDTNYLLIQIEKIDRAKTAEDKLQKEEKRFGALLDYASIAVIIVNRHQEIVLTNPFALNLFGYEYSHELLGKTLNVLIPSRFHKIHNKHHDNYYSNAENRPMGVGMDLFGIKKDGTEFPLEVSLGTYKTDEETFVITFANDITIRKKGEDEILKLNAELEKKVKKRTDELAISISKLQAQIKETEEVEIELRNALEKEKDLSELKSRFVSMASHEFRTPLSTVLSSTYLLQKYINTEDQPKREKHIERIISSVKMLTDILNDFLSVGKIEEGKIKTNFSKFNLCNSINNIKAEMSELKKEGQHIYYTHIGDEIIWLDESMMKHIVMNLLSNAIKFSPEKSIIYIETENKGDHLYLSVKDNGIGMSTDDQKHLFERFFRGTNVTNIQGTGLGLHIVQKYAELMNGNIECISELYKGTTFKLIFEMENKFV